jgi:hypothetical protein
MLFLTPLEVGRLTKELDDRFKALITTGAISDFGGSSSSPVGSRMSCCPPSYRDAHAGRGNGRLFEGPPKTAKGLRSMTIPGFLAEAMGEHIGRYPSKDGHIFSAAEGGPIRKTFIRREFKPAPKASDLLPLRVHDLRHTARVS